MIEIEAPVANGLLVLIAVSLTFIRVIYYQEGIQEGHICWPNVDPMPSIREFRSKLEESARPLRSFLTLKRSAIIAVDLAVAVLMTGFLSLAIDPIIGAAMAVSLLFNIGVDIYQWISVDLGLMRAKWAWWLRNTKA